MITSAAIYHVLHFFHITIDIRNVCVFLAPLFSSFTTIVTYHLTKELKVGGQSGHTLQAFALRRSMGCVPFGKAACGCIGGLEVTTMLAKTQDLWEMGELF